MTTGSRRSAVLAIALAASVTTSAAPGQQRNFVACPIVRDTATVPCWLAEYEGELYFLTLQTDVSAPVNPPQLGHQVLVEGVVSDGPRVCGGVPLEPVVLSVLPELDSSCSTMLPAEDRYNLTFEAPRPPGPSRGRLAFDLPNAAPARAAAPETLPRTFTLRYDFDATVGFKHAGALQQIQELAQSRQATHVDVTAYRAASLLSNGRTLTEREDIGRRRAEQIAKLLKDSGLTTPAYQIRWLDAPAPDGLDDAAGRRADVVLRRD